jgi:hypothetical protein
MVSLREIITRIPVINNPKIVIITRIPVINNPKIVIITSQEEILINQEEIITHPNRI